MDMPESSLSTKFEEKMKDKTKYEYYDGCHFSQTPPLPTMESFRKVDFIKKVHIPEGIDCHYIHAQCFFSGESVFVNKDSGPNNEIGMRRKKYVQDILSTAKKMFDEYFKKGKDRIAEIDHLVADVIYYFPQVLEYPEQYEWISKWLNIMLIDHRYEAFKCSIDNNRELKRQQKSFHNVRIQYEFERLKRVQIYQNILHYSDFSFLREKKQVLAEIGRQFAPKSPDRVLKRIYKPASNKKDQLSKQKHEQRVKEILLSMKKKDARIRKFLSSVKPKRDDIIASVQKKFSLKSPDTVFKAIYRANKEKISPKR
jgi:hypothetical protein